VSRGITIRFSIFGFYRIARGQVAHLKRRMSHGAYMFEGNRTGEPIRPASLFRSYSIEVLGTHEQVVFPADKSGYHPVHQDGEVSGLRINVYYLAVVARCYAVLCVPRDNVDIDGRDDSTSQLVATLPKELKHCLSLFAHHAHSGRIDIDDTGMQLAVIDAGICNQMRVTITACVLLTVTNGWTICVSNANVSNGEKKMTDRTNAERQRRYIAKLKAAAQGVSNAKATAEQAAQGVSNAALEARIRELEEQLALARMATGKVPKTVAEMVAQKRVGDEIRAAERAAAQEARKAKAPAPEPDATVELLSEKLRQTQQQLKGYQTRVRNLNAQLSVVHTRKGIVMSKRLHRHFLKSLAGGINDPNAPRHLTELAQEYNGFKIVHPEA
jgi:hypothetical protein